METVAKMQGIADLAKIALDGIVPYLTIRASDNLASSVLICGAFEAKEEWSYGIFENATSFKAYITPKSGRWFDGVEPVTIEMITKSHKLPTFRRYTGTTEKCIAKLQAWINNHKSA
jgi:hypothetical protein